MSYPATILADNPVGYWRFEETSGTSAADATGNGHTGTIGNQVALAVGGVSNKSAQGTHCIPTNAFGFTGGAAEPNSIVTVPSNAAFNPAHFSAEAWLLLNTPNTFGLFHCRDDGTNRQYQFRNHGAVLQAIIWLGGTPITFNGTTNIADTKWHHVVLVYDGSNVFIYLDGNVELESAQSGALASVTTPLALGGDNITGDSNANGYTGRVDEPAFYGYALTQAQVTAHLTAAACGVQPTIGGLASGTNLGGRP